MLGDPRVIPFTKMHGIGNDYVYLDAITHPEVLVPRQSLPELARRMADRHTGIGSDGLIIIAHPTPDADLTPGSAVRMQMFNADGSEGEMCGNGIRCVCKYAIDHGLVTNQNTEDQSLQVETAAGILDLTYTLEPQTGKVDTVTVDMGEPILELSEIGINPLQIAAADELQDAIFVSMGNPHVILWVDTEEELAELELEKAGARIENHPAFINRINAHYVTIIANSEMRMRTWERGSGITLACGTGAAAVCAAGVLSRKTARQVLIHLPGGDLHLNWDQQTNHIQMTGSATEVFAGEWPTA